MDSITDNAALAAFCNSVKGAPFIAVDTEFMRETTYWPRLCLIQAATPEHEAVIDPLAEGLDLTPFLDLLRDPATVKVFHAARQDVEIFNKLGGHAGTDVRHPGGGHGGGLRRSGQL
jgi:ribonuclease D